MCDSPNLDTLSFQIHSHHRSCRIIIGSHIVVQARSDQLLLAQRRPTIGIQWTRPGIRSLLGSWDSWARQGRGATDRLPSSMLSWLWTLASPASRCHIPAYCACSPPLYLSGVSIRRVQSVQYDVRRHLTHQSLLCEIDEQDGTGPMAWAGGAAGAGSGACVAA